MDNYTLQEHHVGFPTAGVVSIERFLAVLDKKDVLQGKIDRLGTLSADTRMDGDERIAGLLARISGLQEELVVLKKQTAQSGADLRKRNRQLEKENISLKKQKVASPVQQSAECKSQPRK